MKVLKQSWQVGGIYQQGNTKINKSNQRDKNKYLKIYGTDKTGYLWLTPENNFTDDIVVLSNVVWNVY